MLATILALFPEWLTPESLIENGGYPLLFLIIFAESGLLIGFFLPGDSLLFTAGAVAAGAFSGVKALKDVDLNIWILVAGCILAAVAGDQVGYLIGNKAGPRIFNREESRLFKKSHVEKGTEFFEKFGAKAIILARFVPVVRTFVPTIAGVSAMAYSKFFRFNIVGGLLWGGGVTALGYVFGKQQFVKDNFEIAIFAVVAISLLPIVFEVVKARKHRTA